MTADPPAAVEHLPPLRPALDGVARTDRALWCLLPLVGAHAWSERSWIWLTTGVLIAALPWLRSHWRNRKGWDGGSYLAWLMLIILWLPASAAIARGLAMLICVILAIVWNRRDAANPFHPLMTACAIALSIAPTIPDAAPISASVWLAAACALGGGALLGLRAIRWQAPLGMLAGVGLTCAIATALTGAIAVDRVLLALLPSFFLIAFFVTDDPPRTCMIPRARLLCGMLVGALAVAATLALHAAHHDDRLLLALAGAVLFGNAAAPTLDRVFSPLRAARIARR